MNQTRNKSGLFFLNSLYLAGLDSGRSISAWPPLTPKRCFVTRCCDGAYVLLGSLPLSMQTGRPHGQSGFREHGIRPRDLIDETQCISWASIQTYVLPRCKWKSILRTIFLAMISSRRCVSRSCFRTRGQVKPPSALSLHRKCIRIIFFKRRPQHRLNLDMTKTV